MTVSFNRANIDNGGRSAIMSGIARLLSALTKQN